MGKLKQWKICFLEMDYEKSGHHFVVNRYGISVIAIMKKLQNVYYFVSMHHMEKFQIAEPLKQVLVSGFWVTTETGSDNSFAYRYRYVWLQLRVQIWTPIFLFAA